MPASRNVVRQRPRLFLLFLVPQRLLLKLLRRKPLLKPKRLPRPIQPIHLVESNRHGGLPSVFAEQALK